MGVGSSPKGRSAEVGRRGDKRRTIRIGAGGEGREGANQESRSSALNMGRRSSLYAKLSMCRSEKAQWVKERGN